MKALKAFRTRIYPSKAQIEKLNLNASIKRVARNWGLGVRNGYYQWCKETLGPIDLNNLWNKVKGIQYPWTKDGDSQVPSVVFRDLHQAFQHAFRRIKEGKDPGFPKFHGKVRSRQSFRTFFGKVSDDSDKIYYPKVGWIKLAEKEYMPPGKPKQLTLSLRAGR